jgi:adenylate kinase
LYLVRPPSAWFAIVTAMATDEASTAHGGALPRRLLLMGPPGSGKGTIGRALSAWLSVGHVSSGQLLRASVAAGDPYGIGPVVAEGGFVPDEIVLRIVTERLGDGFILDGYPRTAAQAVQLDRFLEARGGRLQVVLDLDVPDDEVRARLARRAGLEGRADDNPGTVEARLVAWHREAGALRAHYRDRLRLVDAVGPPDEVVERAKAELLAARV